MTSKGLRNGAIISFIAAMGLLFLGGLFAKNKVPPIPEKVVAAGKVLIQREGIQRGQNVYQRYGLMDHGAIWGHGSLRGPDFSAHTLHLLGQATRDFYADPNNPEEGAFNKLAPEKRSAVKAQVIEEIHKNTYNHATRELSLSPAQAYALLKVREHWEGQLGKGSPDYGFLENTVPTPEERKDIADFFFWTAWAAGTDRPGTNFTYTNNWPPDRSVGNDASAQAMMWSVISILALFLLLGIIVYVVHRYEFFYGEEKGVKAAQKLLEAPLTESQLAAAKYFLVAGLLFVVQIMNGGLLAHYTVHPGAFYLDFISQWVPYSWAKSWHLQLAVFWIAISWIGTAILVAPMIAGKEPPGQKHLVHILFVAAFLVVAGSLTGEALSIKGLLGDAWYWLGHQGWEYLELGRLWQILLFGGLVFWLVIVYRPLAGIITGSEKMDPNQRSLVIF
jgi:nitric oxide reductase subunit B